MTIRQHFLNISRFVLIFSLYLLRKLKPKKNEIPKLKKPWPTKKAMEQIYKNNLWGGDNIEFYSGDGSHQAEIVTPYLEVLISFLSSFESPITVCDLGCGDFNLGKELVHHTKKYIGIDIVSELITYNKEKFKVDNLEFQCLDIAIDKLPKGDCAILRQVLQHISNAEIQKIVAKLYNYKYLILTEHIPEGDFMANNDIISGQGIRIKKQSGVNLLAPPFNLKIKEEKQLLAIPLKDGLGIIKTTCYKI